MEQYKEDPHSFLREKAKQLGDEQQHERTLGNVQTAFTIGSIAVGVTTMILTSAGMLNKDQAATAYISNVVAYLAANGVIRLGRWHAQHNIHDLQHAIANLISEKDILQARSILTEQQATLDIVPDDHEHAEKLKQEKSDENTKSWLIDIATSVGQTVLSLIR